MKIRVLHESDASLYQELRLQGLQTDAYAFGSTYEREASFSMETMMERVKLSKDKFVLGAFEASGKLAGIVTFVREVGTKTAHKGNVFGMYVSSDMRGKGIGRQLMQGLIEKAKEIEGLEQIGLTVVVTNEPGKKLYESIGFQVYGVEPRALKYEGQYWDETLMVLRLK